MAENTVRYYNDDADSDEMDDMDGAESYDTEQKPEILMRKNEAQSGSVLMIIFISMVAAALLGSVIFCLNKRNTMYNKVAAMNEKLKIASAENVRLQSELDSKMSAKNIEEYAENVLKMQKIDSTQIKYIKTPTDDVVTIPEQEKGLAAKVKAFFDKCVEYFRG